MRRQGPTRRLFVPQITEPGQDMVLEGGSRRYVCDVLRLSRGDSLVLFDGSGVEYPSTIVGTSGRSVTLRILGIQQGRHDSPLHIRVGIGLLKASKMDLVIQKVSELGVQEVCPVATLRAVPALDPDRAAQRRKRWQTIAREASRQSGRSTVAEVGPVESVEEIAGRSGDMDISLLFTPQANLQLDEIARERATPRKGVVVLIGPEGGFSPEEERTARDNGFHPVGLGPRVLRAETAAILAVGLVQYRFGDLGGCREDDAPVDP